MFFAGVNQFVSHYFRLVRHNSENLRPSSPTEEIMRLVRLFMVAAALVAGLAVVPAIAAATTADSVTVLEGTPYN
ncbi:hypothetical protein Lesp02_38850 [Lentzea sp. NBRC 105346]|nr:hypothetical protein Lesp02_38850 [Lentzea sp. NBRC 105346]